MAEERAIESLAEACRDSQTYSAWTRFEALLQRRYLGPSATGTEDKCFGFLFRALDSAGVRYLCAEVAANLVNEVMCALRKHQKPLASDYAMAVMDRVLGKLTSVASVDFEFNPNSFLPGRAAASPPEGPARFMVDFDDTGVMDKSVAKLANLIPWYACLLRFTEVVVRHLADASKLLLPSNEQAAMRYMGESQMRISDRAHLCSASDTIQKWSAAAARAAYALSVCMMASQTFEVALPALAEGAAAEAGVSTGNAGEALRTPFPEKLTLASTLVRLQQWASSVSAQPPGEAKGVLPAATNAIVLATLIYPGGVGGDPQPSWKQLVRVQCWQIAMFIYDTLCRSMDQVNAVMDGSTRTDVYANSDFLAIQRKEAVVMGRVTLDTFRAAPPLAAEPMKSAASGWVGFLEAWLLVMSTCAETRSFERGKDNDRRADKRAAYLRVCRALCAQYEHVLRELPQLHWMELAQGF